MESFYKEKSKENKIRDYYKQKYRKDKIKEASDMKFKSDKVNQFYKEKSIRDKIEENQNDRLSEFYKEKSMDQKVVYRYRKLAEARPIYRVLNSLSVRINQELKEAGIDREFTYIQILGCSVSEFETYLQNKFIDDMSFDNYGEWEIDHIMPVSSFDFNDLEEIKECCHYTNLQPLPKSKNRQKYNKLPTIA